MAAVLVAVAWASTAADASGEHALVVTVAIMAMTAMGMNTMVTVDAATVGVQQIGMRPVKQQPLVRPPRCRIDTHDKDCQFSRANFAFDET